MISNDLQFEIKINQMYIQLMPFSKYIESLMGDWVSHIKSLAENPLKSVLVVFLLPTWTYEDHIRNIGMQAYIVEHLLSS